MSYSVYIGDIDPNNNLDSVINIRRNLLYKLLLWDNIVLSDSQLLTDPRIAVMMGKFRYTPHTNNSEWLDNKEWHKGFELLLENKLIQIAQRTDSNGNNLTMVDLWKNMSSKTTGEVPYLPKTNSYAKFLDKNQYQRRSFKLENIAQRFKNNLCSGVESGALTMTSSDDTDKEILRLFNGDNVLFRDILQTIRIQLSAGKINKERYDEIYRYVYSCYHTNVPAEIGCYVCTNPENLPLHLELGNTIEGASHEVNSKNIRPTWALDPSIIDLLPIESFLKVREAIKPCLESEKLMKYNTGVLQSEEINEYYDVWEEYTKQLEKELLNQLWSIYDDIDSQIDKHYVPTQQRIKNGVTELVISGFKNIPILGNIIDTVENMKKIKDYCEDFIMLNQKKDMDYFVKYKKEIKTFLRNQTDGAKVITCYKQ